LMARCAGIKRDGGRCAVGVPAGVRWCFNHDPARASERKRNASRAGRTKGTGEIADLKKQLEDLAAGVLAGEVARSDATVVNQIINTRARLVELERKMREQEVLEERLEALEAVLKVRNAG
jgi:hypothetical protein